MTVSKNTSIPLTAQQRAIIPMASLAATGHIDKLSIALNDALDAGVSVNEAK